jgi:S-adenosylmethionine decarboxylase
MVGGTEWLIDAEGCDPELLRDGGVLRAVAETIVEQLGLRCLSEPLWHQFPGPGGWTGVYMLRESHLTCHTFPEMGLAAWNLYCCRSRPEWSWERELKERLGATRVVVRRAVRGVLEAALVTALPAEEGRQR